MQERPAIDSVSVVWGFNSARPFQFRELSLVSMPFEGYSMLWNCCCSEQRCDGLVQGSSSTSSECCQHIVDSNVASIECLFAAATDIGHCADVRIIVQDSDFWNGDQISTTVAWEADEMMSPRERIQLFRQHMSGKVVISETWPGEEKLKEWAPHGVVEDALRPLGLMIARAALVNDSLSKSRLASSRLPVPRPTSVSPMVLPQVT